jgi:AcrR family transcriptional regulator
MQPTMHPTMPSTMSRRPGRPPAANANETRKRIVRAARQVFTERGYVGATFQEIANRANLTRPAINHYFPSKRALFRAVADHTNELVVASGIERARGETSLAGRLSAFVTVAMHASIENPSTAAFLVADVVESRRHPELSTPDNDSLEISRSFLHWAVNDAIERGEVAADIDVPALAETLLVLLCGVGFYAGYVRRPHDEMDLVNAMLRQLLAGAVWRPAT